MHTYQVASENARNTTYEMFGRNKKMVDDDVEIIKAWMKTQPHLPEMMEDVKIKNFLNLSKFSIEKTKTRIDMYYTIRSVIPEIFEKSNPKLENIKMVFDTTYVSQYPRLIDGMHRLIYVKWKKPDTLDILGISKVWFSIFEIRLYEDFIVDDILVANFDNVALNDLRKFTPTFLTKFFTVYQKVYGLRLKEIIYINCPSYISILANILKAVMKPKIFDRIQFHKDDAILKKRFHKNEIPKDYGGDGPSLQELNDLLQRKFSEYQYRFDTLDQLKVNEDLRPGKLDNDEILGFYGSFKKIDLD